jgi:hypothetical protein
LEVRQQTRYPWSGEIKIAIDPDKTGTFTLKTRVPGWARNQAMPGDLYRFADTSDAAVKVRLNGKEIPVEIENGYAAIRREWRRGDVVELDLPMNIRRVRASGEVAADRDRVALQRGPIVYAAEWVDSPDRHVRNVLLADDQPLKAEWRPNLLKGVEVIQGKVAAFRYDADHRLQRTEEAFTAIPYYAWANRGAGQMEVWIATRESAVHATPYPSIASEAKVTTSGPTMAENGVRDPKLVADQEEPISSTDSNSFYDWLPKRGSQEWIQYDFVKPTLVSSVDVYWFREAGNRSIQLPANWRLLCKDGSSWKPVATSDSFGTAPDRYNHVAIRPVTTNGLRLEVTLQPDKSAGISEWRVN